MVASRALPAGARLTNLAAMPDDPINHTSHGESENRQDPVAPPQPPAPPAPPARRRVTHCESCGVDLREAVAAEEIEEVLCVRCEEGARPGG